MKYCILSMLCLFSLVVWSNDVAYRTYQDGILAIKHQNWDAYDNAMEKLIGHPFESALRYKKIKANFTLEDTRALEQFISDYPKSPMATWLKRDWYAALYKNQNYQALVNNYTDVNSKDHQCRYIYALYQVGDIDKAEREIKKSFKKIKSHSKICSLALITYLQFSNDLRKDGWTLFMASIEDFNFKFARSIMSLLVPSQQENAKAIFRLYKNPHLIYKKSFINKYKNADLLSYGLYRLARINPRLAEKYFNKYSKNANWTAKQQQRVLQAIALKYALRKNKRSLYIYKKLIGQNIPNVYQTYMLKAALYHKDWRFIKNMIDGFEQVKKDQPKYQYWYARSLEKLNYKDRSSAIYNKLSKLRNYYGFLAANHTKQQIKLESKMPNYSEQDLIFIRNLPGMVRTKIYYENKQYHKARLELYYLLRNNNDLYDYLIVQEVQSWGWHSQAIRLSYKLAYKDDLSFRFPIKYLKTIAPAAKKYKVAPALVYAIIRQESLFTENIKSHAGAIGLMQLMPETAKRTAKKYRINYKGASTLKIANINLELGIAHLGYLKRIFSNQPLLVIASYNAGKKAALRWRPKQGQKLPADMWIEMVTYKETRNYLKHVVANYFIYQSRLNHLSRTSSLLTAVR